MSQPSPIIIYTDGACLGNPGPGGWAAVLAYNGTEREISGSEAATTNNRMEITAVIRALETLKKNDYPVHIYTDSKYVMQGMQEWLPRWRRNGFRTANKKPVKNEALWKTLDNIAKQYQIQWFWVRGHDGCAGNERADALATAAAREGQAA